MTEAVTVDSLSHSHEEDFDDVGCNADLHASRQGAFQGCSAVVMSDHNKRLIPIVFSFQPLSHD